MNAHQLCSIALVSLANLCQAATVPPADARPDAQLSPVTVQQAPVPAVKRDVRAACPAIDAELQRTLSSAWTKVYLAGTMRVQFRVENQRVTEVHSSGSLQDYRPYIRKAMSRLNCSVASAGPQDYRFLLVVRDPDDVSAPDQFALLTEE